MPGDANPLAGLGVEATPNQPNPLAGLGVPAAASTDAASTGNNTQPGALSRAWEGAKDFGKETYASLPIPRDSKEQVIYSVVGPGGLMAYRSAKGLINSAEQTIASTPEQYEQAVNDFRRAHQEFVNKDYKNAIPSAVSAGASALGVVPQGRAIGDDVRELSEGARPGGDLARPLTRDALTVGSMVVPGMVEDALESRAAAAATGPMKVNPFRKAMTEISQGDKVAQAPAQSAVREGVQASTVKAGTTTPPLTAHVANAPLLDSGETMLDAPLRSVRADEQAAYAKVDQTAGFDLKAERQQLDNDEYKIKQLGNTTADQATRKTLSAAINDSKARITQAEAKLKQAGVDPSAGDIVHRQRMAGEDFRNVLIKATKLDGTVDVDKLVNNSKALRYGKRGDRLAQFMGDKAADDYMDQLLEAQKMGVHAMKVQKIAKWVGGIAATGLVGGTVAEGVGKLLAPAE